MRHIRITNCLRLIDERAEEQRKDRVGFELKQHF